MLRLPDEHERELEPDRLDNGGDWRSTLDLVTPTGGGTAGN
jgi:hypothetical protein